MSDRPTRPGGMSARDRIPSEDTYLIEEADAYMDALEHRNRELERRPTVANHNALQEECDSRLVVHKRQCERITELEAAWRMLVEGGCITPYHPQEHDAVTVIAKMEDNNE